MLVDSEIERIPAQQNGERSRFAFSDDALRQMIAFARAHDCSYNDTHTYKDIVEVTGMAPVTVSIRRSDGRPAGAIHVTG